VDQGLTLGLATRTNQLHAIQAPDGPWFNPLSQSTGPHGEATVLDLSQPLQHLPS